MLFGLTGLDMQNVMYRTQAEMLPDLMNGMHALSLVTSGLSMPHIRDGRLKALAISAPRRSPDLPNVPTMAEAGLPAAETYSWIVLMAPANTPRGIIDMLNREVGKALSNIEVRARMAEFAFDVDARLSPTETRDFIHAEALKWAPVVKASGAVAE